ncbi:TPA: hypothetical protein SMF36_000350 [Serratia marcescens]|nr:hypothetical protein [Serratia marcescens]HEJ6977289.1 hypothetical protein [Serratia marcescens]
MLTTEQLSQIKADISARKAMPEYGESIEGNIERLRVIGATRSHFSTETVEMLVRALEEKSRSLADAERERDDWVEHSRRMEYRAIEAKELLANREAQPVAWTTVFGDKRAVTVHAETAEVWNSDGLQVQSLFTAPPAPANAQPVGEIHTVAESRNPGVNIHMFNSEKIIPNGTKLYAAPPAPAVPEEMKRDPDADVFDPGFMNGWNACRAAMLAQPVSGGYKLPDNVREALTLALQAMEFMGDTLNNIDAVCAEDVEYVAPAFNAVRELLAAVPEGGNGA